MKKITFVIAMVISTFVFGQNSWVSSVGENAKDFSLKTATDERVNLKELLSAKAVVLVVLRGWPGYQCPICTKQVGSLISAAAGFEKRQVSVLMIYPGPSEELTKHAKEFKADFSFPTDFYFAIDPDYSMVNLYGIRWNANRETAYPSTFIMNKEGKIVYSRISHSHAERSTPEELFEVLDKL